MLKKGTTLFSLEKFISKAKKVHGDKYNYDNTIYQGMRNPISMLCNRCGNIAHNKVAINHLKKNGGCICYRIKDWELKNKGFKKCTRCGEIKKFECFYGPPGPQIHGNCILCETNLPLEERLALRKKARDRGRKVTPKRKLRASISNLVKCSLRRILNKKKTHTWPFYLGYSFESFKDHMESLFTKDMSWDNYGMQGWTIDHIIPLAAFKQTTDSSYIKKLWDLKNIRPFPFKLNSGKRDRFYEEARPLLPSFSEYLTDKYLKEAETA